MRPKPIALMLLATACAFSAQAQRMYKCVDAKGRTYYTQVPPPECLGRETDELSKSGDVIKRNVVLTPEQRAAEEAARKKKAEEEEKAKEERRKNAALLNTYSSVKDIEDARARALGEAQASIREIEQRIAEAKKRQKELAAEKEFYQKKPMPPKLAQDIRDNELILKTQAELLEAKKKEIGTINARYDEDKRRYLELTRGKVPAAAR